MNLEEARRTFRLGEDDVAAWRASGLAEADFDGWLVDRVARRPAGARARSVYGAEDIHDFARAGLLRALGLGPGDRLLEIGCGGGLLLRAALERGATVTGIDHSEEMVRLARERAPGATVIEADAERLPFPDGSFTAAALSIVFMFLPAPVAALRECHRVLVPAARLALYTTSPELRGTPAAPEPMASHTHMYADDELAALASEAGFADVSVQNEGGGQLLTARR